MSTPNNRTTTKSVTDIRSIQSTPDVFGSTTDVEIHLKDKRERQTETRAHQHRDSALSRADDEQLRQSHSPLMSLLQTVAKDEGVAKLMSQDKSVEQSFHQFDQLFKDHLKHQETSTALRQNLEEKLTGARKDQQILQDRAESLMNIQEEARRAGETKHAEFEAIRQAGAETSQALQTLGAEIARLEQLQQQAKTQQANSVQKFHEVNRYLEELAQRNAQAEKDLAALPKLHEAAQSRIDELEIAVDHASNAEQCAKASRKALEQSATAEVRRHVSLAKARQAVGFETEVDAQPTVKVTVAPITTAPVAPATAPTSAPIVVPPVAPIVDNRSVETKQTTTKTGTDANGNQVQVTDKHATKDSTNVQTKPAGCLARCRDKMGCVKPSKTATATVVTTKKTVEEQKASNTAINIRNGTTTDSQGRHVRADDRE